MKHLASIAVLTFLASAHVAMAEDQTAQQQQAKKQAKKQATTHSSNVVHNTQATHKVKTTNVQNNPNLHVQSHHTGTTVTPNINKQMQNAASAHTVTNTQHWKNNPNWKSNPNWNGNPNGKKTNWKSKNWWAGNPQWQSNHSKWANYHHWDRVHRDRTYWTSHYSRFALFGGGYYYWNNGFWYPAYGYDPTFSTYAYDAPIYAANDQEPSEVIAAVQNALSQAGYEPGPVDNTYGPRTRSALLRYQADNGLPETGHIDEPTLASLGLD